MLVAEEEPRARKYLVRCIEAAGGAEIAAVCGDGREALAALERHPFDVAMLEIEMPHVSGVDVARAVADGQPAAGVIFTATHPGLATAAFDLDAVDYLVKPFDAARVALSLERARRRRAATPVGPSALDAVTQAVGLATLRGRRLVIRTSGRFRLVDAAEICFVSSEGDYCTVNLGRDSLLARHVLKDLEAQLVGGGFLRIHRRVLINVGHLREVRPWRHGDFEFVMADGTVFQSGPTYRLPVQRFLETPGFL